MDGRDARPGGSRRGRQNHAFERFEALLDVAEGDLDGPQAVVQSPEVASHVADSGPHVGEP